MAKGDIEAVLECQKCKAISGDNWSQCEGGCPVSSSPYYTPEAFSEHGPLKLIPFVEYYK